MEIEPEAMLTILVVTLVLLAVTGWALAIYVMVSQERAINRLRSDVGELDRDIGNLWQVTFADYRYQKPMVPAEILPFIKRPS